MQDSIEIALDKECYQYERWIHELSLALKFGDEPTREMKRGLRRLERWDGFQDRKSNGALVYYYWKNALLESAGQDGMRELTANINHYLDIFGIEEPERALTESDYAQLAESFKVGLATMRERHGSLRAKFGDVFRAGRLDYDGDDESYPVGGGSLRWEGMATVRAIGFTDEREDWTRWGQSGQTSTQVVILSNPIKSFTQPPIGQSDHPDSLHFRDQAKKLLSKIENEAGLVSEGRFVGWACGLGISVRMDHG